MNVLNVCAIKTLKAISLFAGPGWGNWVALCFDATLYVIIAPRFMLAGLRSDLLAMTKKAYIQ